MLFTTKIRKSLKENKGAEKRIFLAIPSAPNLTKHRQPYTKINFDATLKIRVPLEFNVAC